jgi:hypothetical protein
MSEREPCIACASGNDLAEGDKIANRPLLSRDHVIPKDRA